jgi:3-hydroxyacyl-[acyl-carrier-protein] dehydratase
MPPELSPHAGLEALARLPHRDPFRFVTQVTSLKPGETGQAIWTITGIEDFFKGHFPGEPIVPGVLISEALAQLSGLVGLHESAGQSGRLVHVDIRFDAPVRPPADILLSATLTRSLGQLRLFDVAARVQENPVARGSLTLALIDQQ